ncbi:MAG: EamA family transporter [Chitinophagaceae bacterium]|nr:EamA family transporter [Chitinophagaceae bacterium]
MGSVFSSAHNKYLPVLYTSGLQLLCGGILILITSFFTGQLVPIANIPLSAVGSLAYLVLIGSVLTYSAYSYALTKLPPFQVSVYAFINPLVALGLGWMILHEAVSVLSITGTLVTLFGVFLVVRASHNNSLQKKQILRKPCKKKKLSNEQPCRFNL